MTNISQNMNIEQAVSFVQTFDPNIKNQLIDSMTISGFIYTAILGIVLFHFVKNTVVYYIKIYTKNTEPTCKIFYGIVMSCWLITTFVVLMCFVSALIDLVQWVCYSDAKLMTYLMGK